jgi:GNAT superfamily N-acetyltransferase
MPTIRFTTVQTAVEVQQILELQRQNVPSALSAEQQASQGFVTVQHTFPLLERMNAAAPSIIAKAGEQLAGYCLMMPRSFVAEIPILQELVDTAEGLPGSERLKPGLSWHGKPLRGNPRWFIMGQVGVAEAYRGQGVFDGLYQLLRDTYRPTFDFVITEIAARNTRSRRAHARVGFQDVAVHAEPNGEAWHVVVLDC